MSAQYRQVEVAAGHSVIVRRVPRTPVRDGKVLVVKSHRPPFLIDEARWNAAPVRRAS